MIQKFAGVPGLRIAQLGFLMTILAGAITVQSQQTAPSTSTPPPAQPQTQPDAQSSSGSQEASPEEIEHPRKPVHDYKNWVYSVGAGASLTSGTTNKFVRSGGGIAAAGVARNYSKYLGLRLDFQFDNLPLRASALQAAQAPGANSHVYSLSFDPIINVPVTKNWGGYILIGPSFFHRSGKLDSSTAIPGSACNSFFLWWGPCYHSTLPLSGDFLKASQNEFGENFGGGITRKIRPNIDLYAEFRIFHGAHSGITTDVRPITVGLRW